MSDLISRQDALDAIDKNRQDLLSLGMDGAEHILVHYGRRVIEELPSTEKVGEWAVREGELAFWDVCDQCGKKILHRTPFYKFCPNCGATMEGGEEDE